MGAPKAGELRIEYMPLTTIQPAIENPHLHDLGALHSSLSRHGYTSPVLINEKTGRLVAGHGRVDALRQRKAEGQEPPQHIVARDGEWFVPVVRGLSFATDAEASAYLLADNKLSELGGWDDQGLAKLLTEIAASENGLVGTGYDGDDLDKLLRDIQRASGAALTSQDNEPTKSEELQKKWGTALGQMWDIAGHRVWCGSSLEVPDALFDGNKVRLIWTDPPYGVSYANKNAYLNRTDRGNRIQTPIVNDHMTPEATQTLFTGALTRAVPHCEEGAAIYATVPGGPLYVRFVAAIEDAGFTFKHGLVWVKNHFVIGMSDYHFRHEPILYGWLETGAHYWNGDRSQDSVFEVDKPHSSDLHPTTKPVELIARMIANSTQPTDIVYDPFCGSGTTLVAAHQLGRIGYGVELDPGYVAVELERLSALGLTPRLIEEAAQAPDAAAL
jgi:DNA modification methylase